MSHDDATLAQRVEQIETRLRGTLDVARVRILGRDGRPALELGTSPEGEPEIVLLDASGRDRVLVRLVEGECSLELMGSDGRPAVRAASSAEASRVVAWAPGSSARRVEMRAASDGTATVAVIEGRDAVRALIGVTSSGEPVVRAEPAARKDP